MGARMRRTLLLGDTAFVNVSEARERFRAQPVARLATSGADGRPHVVPCTFALLGDDTIVSAVDDVKPKRTRALRRLANIQHNPRVALLADHYADDWSALWWVRADGVARVVAPGDEPDLRAAALDALAARYAPYRAQPPLGPLVVVDVVRWSGWTAATPSRAAEPGS
jgi:PPOX class probable F420-dependent enzyme